MVGGDRKVRKQRDRKQGEMWRDRKELETRRETDMRVVAEVGEEIKGASHGKRDKEKDRRQIDRSVGRETERQRDMGDSHKVIATETFP